MLIMINKSNILRAYITFPWNEKFLIRVSKSAFSQERLSTFIYSQYSFFSFLERKQQLV